jgi:hypothetical protein
LSRKKAIFPAGLEIMPAFSAGILSADSIVETAASRRNAATPLKKLFPLNLKNELQFFAQRLGQR